MPSGASTFNYDPKDPAAYFRAHDVATVSKGATDVFSGIVTNKEWSDAYFLEEYEATIKSLLPKSRELNVAVMAAKNVLNWYAGIIPAQTNPETLFSCWVSMLVCVRIGAGTYVYQTGDANPKVTNPDEPTATTEVQYISDSGLSSGTLRVAAGSAQRVFNVQTMEDWRTEMVKYLNSEEEVDQYEAIRQISFLLDTTFRSLQKDPSAVSIHIATRASDSYKGVTAVEPKKLLPPPQSKFLEFIHVNFNEKHEVGRNRLLISMYAVYKGSEAKVIKGWLASTHMLSLGGTGLGLIEWFFKVVKMTGHSPEFCLPKFNYGNMVESVAKLIHWGEISAKQVTWRWSRLIEDDSLIMYSTEKNRYMASTCALITASNDYDTVKTYTQFFKYLSVVKACVPDAIAISKILLSNATGEAYGEDATLAREAANRIRLEIGDQNDIRNDREDIEII